MFALALYRLHVEEDFKGAFDAAKIAAEADYTPAQTLLGTFYLEGIGRPRDYIQVFPRSISSPYSFIIN